MNAVFLLTFSIICAAGVVRPRCAHAEKLRANPLPAQAQGAKSADPASVPAAVAKLPPAGITSNIRHEPDLGIELRGWGHLYQLLVRDGVSRDEAAAALSDARMPRQETLIFGLRPGESKQLYRKHNTKSARRNALRFYARHRANFERAYAAYGVSPEVVLAILQVETHCGKNTGRTPIFYRLARLADAANPENIKANYELRQRKGKDIKLERILERALWLEQEFLPHAAAAIKTARQLNLDPHELRGSEGGAIGIPQFLPGNIHRHGADGNGDGRIDIFSAPDAIASVARFLKQSGWKPGTMSRKDKKRVLWAYNRSVHYIDTVLAMAELLRPRLSNGKR